MCWPPPSALIVGNCGKIYIHIDYLLWISFCYFWFFLEVHYSILNSIPWPQFLNHSGIANNSKSESNFALRVDATTHCLLSPHDHRELQFNGGKTSHEAIALKDITYFQCLTDPLHENRNGAGQLVGANIKYEGGGGGSKEVKLGVSTDIDARKQSMLFLNSLQKAMTVIFETNNWIGMLSGLCCEGYWVRVLCRVKIFMIWRQNRTFPRESGNLVPPSLKSS